MDEASSALKPDGVPAVTVLYDGACPLCRREIALYRGLRSERAVCFVDVSDASLLPAETTREQLLARFHVQRADGTLVSGAAAFLTLWAHLQPVLTRRVRADLRSDHAGETGAVAIYRGILFVTRDSGLRAFAQRHLHTEQQHLDQLETWLPSSERSRLLPAWRVAGWATGALPALFGPPAVYATIAAVETFVDRHYAEQIAHLQIAPGPPGLHDTLAACQADERTHLHEAAASAPARAGAALRMRCRLVGAGSSAAVALARRF